MFFIWRSAKKSKIKKMKQIAINKMDASSVMSTAIFNKHFFPHFQINYNYYFWFLCAAHVYKIRSDLGSQSTKWAIRFEIELNSMYSNGSGFLNISKNAAITSFQPNELMEYLKMFPMKIMVLMLAMFDNNKTIINE